MLTTMGMMLGTTLKGLIAAALLEGESDLIEELAEGRS